MKSFGIYITFFLLCVAFFLFIFFYRGIATGVFRGSRFLSGAFSSGDASRLLELEKENALLKEENFRLGSRSPSPLSFRGGEVIWAGVYSRYPFSDKETLVVDFGAREGATSGMPVLAGDNVLIGEIVSVQNAQSEVRTMFDARWVGSVFIRLSSSPGVTARGVLKGGSAPRVELVGSEFPLRKGDVVVNASEKFPLGLPLGVLETLKKGEGGFWEEVTLRPIFRSRDLSTVSVLRDFP
ncbi:MAG: rod shape-determining protein MreC [Patescibacteria group bacterium]